MSKIEDRLAAIEARLDTLEAAGSSGAAMHLKASEAALARMLSRQEANAEVGEPGPDLRKLDGSEGRIAMAWTDYVGSYSKEYVPAALLAAFATNHQLGIFFRLDSDPGLHLWCGVNDIPAGFDSDVDGTVYLGAGRLLNIPVLELLFNGQSTSVEFGLSGLDPDLAAPLMDTLPETRGKDVTIGVTALDDYFQPITAVIALWSGVAADPIEDCPTVTGGENPKTSISLGVFSGSAKRSRPALSMWSSAHQKAMYPTDLGCDQTAELARGRAPIWPPT